MQSSRVKTGTVKREWGANGMDDEVMRRSDPFPANGNVGKVESVAGRENVRESSASQCEAAA